MKQGWERMNGLEPLSLKDAEKTVRIIKPDAVAVCAIPLETGLSSSNYRIELDDGAKVVLRLPRNSGLLEKEEAIHGLLAANTTVPWFRTAGQAALLEWKDGILLRDVLEQGSDLMDAGRSAGQTLGGLRKAAAFNEEGDLTADLEVGFRFSLTPDFFKETIEYFFSTGKAGSHMEPGLAEEVKRFAEANGYLLEKDDTGAGLVHGDFNGLNILMEGSNVSAVLDWEYAMSGSLYIDIGNMIRYDTYPGFELFEKGMIEGLERTGFHLSGDWKQLARIADLVSLCSMLDHDTIGPNRKADLIRLIRRTVREPIY
ncbi:phosphotransferase family protein [Alteribacter natronophilus]|uniref:phosphotransferase family protein n=1 Tax=Alteribacter natronophilus TaxID=2583810 RepID=UPI00110DC09C|nr:aminoglycoside phosphotransferase family protein [Alteribacter natronophilus]TMW70352.1 aminoglycoside phosphotransferase family protein [Alteribacter natronophilus]